MKLAFKTLATAVIVSCFSVGAMASDDHEMHKHEQHAQNMMHSAEVKKVLAEKGKITLKHGELKEHNMPPMTMMFKVKDASMIEGLQKGDQVEFSIDKDLVVQEIKKK